MKCVPVKKYSLVSEYKKNKHKNWILVQNVIWILTYILSFNVLLPPGEVVNPARTAKNKINKK